MVNTLGTWHGLATEHDQTRLVPPLSTEDQLHTARCDATLLIPAYNEAHRLVPVLEMYSRAMAAQFGENFELLVVANGCTDTTVQVAHAYAEIEPAISVLNIDEPVGKGGAILEGFRVARGRSIAFVDADGSTAPDSVMSLFQGLNEHDIVIGSRRLPGSVITRPQPAYRRLLGRLFAGSVRSLFRMPFSDTQCGAKAFTQRAASLLAGNVQETRWTFDVDLLLSAKSLGLSVTEQPVVWGDAEGSRLRVVPAVREVASSFWRISQRQRSLGSGSAISSPGGLRILAMNWRCIRHPQSGGAEANLFEQARLWVKDGHQVTVCCAEIDHKSGPSSEVIDGITVRRRGGRFSVYLFAAWFVMLHSRSFDRILDVANGVPFFAPLFTRVPASLLVHHVHDRQWFTEFSPPVAAIGRFLEMKVVPRVYRGRPVIAVSPTTRDALVRTGVAPSSIHVIYNGISGIHAPAHPESQPSPAHRIAYVGRLKRYKRIERLIEVTAALRLEFPDVHLDIAGDGDARHDIEKLVAALDLGNHVTVHGFVDDATKIELLRNATVFATPSMHEGWGLSVLEANACGCPAVAYNVPGLSVAIRHGETGLLAGDDDGFQEAIASLLRDATARQRYAEASVSWASRFSWSSSATQTLHVLSNALAASGSVLLPPAEMDSVA